MTPQAVTAASAVMFTRRRTVAVSMRTGLAAPPRKRRQSLTATPQRNKVVDRKQL
jgi:hypothetical protein